MSMAAQRATERDNGAEINLVLAGPYIIPSTVKSRVARERHQFFMVYLVTAWQKIYGTVYAKATEAFKLPYASTIESLLPSQTLNFTILLRAAFVSSSAKEFFCRRT